VAIPADRIVTKKKAEKKLIQEFMCRDMSNVKLEMYGSNWSHRNIKKIKKKKIGSHTGKTFNKFITQDSNDLHKTH
jgi:hypothetical protein